MRSVTAKGDTSSSVSKPCCRATSRSEPYLYRSGTLFPTNYVFPPCVSPSPGSKISFSVLWMMGCVSIKTFASSSRVCKYCAANAPAAWTGFSWPWPPAMITANIKRFACRTNIMADTGVRNMWESQSIFRRQRTPGVLFLLLVALPLSGCGYNTMVSLKEQVQSAWAQVENQLQRRNDLIPNLVETTKGYAAHEKEVFESVANA